MTEFVSNFPEESRKSMKMWELYHLIVKRINNPFYFKKITIR